MKTKTDDFNINIINLFADFKLTNTYPFTKLVLDNYESYYKIFKPSIN